MAKHNDQEHGWAAGCGAVCANDANSMSRCDATYVLGPSSRKKAKTITHSTLQGGRSGGLVRSRYPPQTDRFLDLLFEGIRVSVVWVVNLALETNEGFLAANAR